MADLLAGTVIRGLDTPATQSDSSANSFDATITSFGTATTAGSYDDVAVVFTAPTTGRVKIHTSARMINSSTGGTLVSPETRSGGTIGSGTVVDAAADANGVSHYGASFSRIGVCHLLDGLTPGNTYNTRLLHRASANTATVTLRQLIVEPAT